MTDHLVDVWTSIGGGHVHQAFCTCGWRGDFTLSVLAAEADGDGHRELIKNSAKEANRE